MRGEERGWGRITNSREKKLLNGMDDYMNLDQSKRTLAKCLWKQMIQYQSFLDEPTDFAREVVSGWNAFAWPSSRGQVLNLQHTISDM